MLIDKIYVPSKIIVEGELKTILVDQGGYCITKENWEILKSVVDETLNLINPIAINKEHEKRMLELTTRPSSPRAKKDLSGQVYFVKSETGHFKIGKTKNIKTRIKSLQTSSPYNLELLCYFKTSNMGKTEQEIQDIFSTYCTSGEWFDITENQIMDLLDFNDIEVLYND